MGKLGKWAAAMAVALVGVAMIGAVLYEMQPGHADVFARGSWGDVLMPAALVAGGVIFKVLGGGSTRPPP